MHKNIEKLEKSKKRADIQPQKIVNKIIDIIRQMQSTDDELGETKDHAEIWNYFEEEFSRIAELNILRKDFLDDLIDFKNNVLSAMDMLNLLKKISDKWENKRESMKSDDARNMLYEASSVMDFLSAKIEDISYLINKIKERKINEEIKFPENQKLHDLYINIVRTFVDLCNNIYDMLLLEYHTMVDFEMILTLEGDIKRIDEVLGTDKKYK